MKMGKYVLAIGELLVDAISSEQVKDLSQATALKIHPGGSTANFCRYLKRCGTHSEIVSAVGMDGFGQILLDKVKAEGLKTDHILQWNNHFTSLVVVGRNAGTPDFIPYRDADKYITDLDKALVEEAGWVHSTAFSLSVDPARTSIIKALSIAKKKDITVSVDWNYSEKIWSSLREAQDVFDILQSLNPYLKFSMDDVARFTGKPDLSIEEAQQFLNTVRAAFICLTCGNMGVYYKVAHQPWNYEPVEPIDVKNATGAGDSFWAGFVHASLQNETITHCIRFAMKTASDKLQGLLHAPHKLK